LSIPKLKVLLGIQDDESKEYQAEFAYEQAEEMVKNYCRIDRVPTGLSNVVLSMAIDLYRAGNFGSEAPATGAVQSISEGDIEVAFRPAVSTAENRYMENPGMAFLKNYVAQLDRYRKAGW